MTIRRHAAAVGAVALGFLALSACSKPTPLATVTVGDSSATVSAERAKLCWHDGSALSDTQVQHCAQKSAPATTLKVNANDKVHLGVEPSVSDTGWVVLYAQDGGQPQQATNFNKNSTYTTLNAPAGALFQNQQTGVKAKSVDLVFLQNSKAAYAGTTQVWKVRLELSS